MRLHVVARLLIALCCAVAILFAASGYASSGESALARQLRIFPVAWVDRDEAPTARAERLNLVWDAVKAFPDRERRAVLAIGFGESRFAEYVMRDCVDPPGEASGNCDEGRSRGYWQIQRLACPQLHALPRGSGAPIAVKIGAECARKQWRWALRRCNGNVEQSFAAYGGRRCGQTTESTQVKEQWFRRLGGER